MTADDDIYWYDDATYISGIHYYYPHTKEINFAFKSCLCYCILLTFLLPCAVSIYQLWMRRRIRQKKESTESTIDDSGNGNNNNNNDDDGDNLQQHETI